MVVAARKRSTKSKAFKPSKYQQAVFDWITNGSGNAVVNAVAGAGKTSTIVEAAKLVDGDCLFIAFNTHIVDELKKRLPETTDVKTCHSLGNGAIRDHLSCKVKLDAYKYSDLCKDAAKRIERKLKRRSKDSNDATPYSILKDLSHFSRVTLTAVDDYDALNGLIDHYAIEILDDDELEVYFDALEDLIWQGNEMAERGIIDFTDMIYLPSYWNLLLPQYDFVFGDEVQDWSAAQLDLVLKTVTDSGRLCLVGDKSQAIYGFAGSDCNSINKIIQRTNAIELPLSICYRCPSSHIELAKDIVPQIEAKPKAPKGEIETLKKSEVLKAVQRDALIICRTTAPLINLCIELIANKIPAKVKGRDIGKSLSSLVEQIVESSDKFNFEDFEFHLEDYRKAKVVKLLRKKNGEAQIESLNDRLDGILACYHTYDSKTPDELCKDIEGLFSDNQSFVMLSTVHRAKGLEADRVFILRPDLMPLQWRNQQPHDYVQEMNIKYISLTRAKQSLFFIRG